MAQQIINNGTTAGDGTGENLFNAFEKVNDNFTELYARTDIGSTASTTALTASDLNTAFPSAPNGFRVQALNMIPNPLIYTKVSTGWASAIITIL
jgi:hypothetical protein